MVVKVLPSGRRSVEAEVVVPGTIEKVWRAIATGEGISSWFVPTTVDGRVGGTCVSNFGPGMESAARIIEWNPPNSFVAETDEPPETVKTEWIVGAHHGGGCVVRVIHIWTADTDKWDAQFEDYIMGWQSFFRILRLYLTHFADQPCLPLQISGSSDRSLLETWDTLVRLLGIDPSAQHIVTAGSAPRLSGNVETRGDAEHPELMIHMSEPVPGIADLFAMPLSGKTFVSMRFYLHGERGKAEAPTIENEWKVWLTEHFPLSS